MRSVVILEDDPTFRDLAIGFVRQWNSEIAVIAVDTVEAAKAELVGATDVCGAIIDLLIESGPAGQHHAALPQGKDLVEWLQRDARLATLPVLILSAFEEMILDARRLTGGTITVASRNQDFAKVRSTIKAFIERLGDRASAGE